MTNPTEQKLSKEEMALGAFLSAMHEQGLDGEKMRAAMLSALGISANGAQQAAAAVSEPTSLLMPPTKAPNTKLAPADLSQLPKMHGHNGQEMYRVAKEIADLLATTSTDEDGLRQQLHIANIRIRALQNLAVKVEELEEQIATKTAAAVSDPVKPAAYDGSATEGGARYQADQHLRALLRYSENFYGVAIEHGMKAGEIANAIAHIEKAGKALHQLVRAWADTAEKRTTPPAAAIPDHTALLRQALEALIGMQKIHTEPAGFDGKFGKELELFLAIQEEKIEAALLTTTDAIAALRTALGEQA